MCVSMGCSLIGEDWKVFRYPEPCSAGDRGTAARYSVSRCDQTVRALLALTLDEIFLALVGQHFERLLARLRDQQRGQDAGDHEERKDLQA